MKGAGTKKELSSKEREELLGALKVVAGGVPSAEFYL